MKKQFLLKSMMLAMLMMVSMGAWAETAIYTFTSKSWAATDNNDNAANWTSNKDGGAMISDRGVRVTTTYDGAGATSPTSFPNVSEVVVLYSTNATAGAGSIAVSVGGTDYTTASNVTKDGGETDRILTFTPTTVASGNVTFTVNCTTNSIYVKSVLVVYKDNATNVFNETFGTPTDNINVTAYDGWSETSVVYSGSAKVGVTESNRCGLAGSSQSGYMYMSTANINDFVISGINTSAYKNCNVKFNYKGGEAASKFKLEYSTDNGENYTEVVNSPSMATTWQASDEYELPSSSNLTLKFTLLPKSDDTYAGVYFDDLIIKGIPTVTIGAAGVTTYYHSSRSYTMPEGLTGYIVVDAYSSTGKLGLVGYYPSNEIVPAGEALILKGAAGTYELEKADAPYSPVFQNILKGTDVAATTTGGDVYYMLAVDPTTGLGFYWGAENGAAFTNGAHKAYLPLTSAQAGTAAAKGFALDFDDVTGIEAIENVKNESNAAYNLNGQRVNANQKGIVIVNGRKYINK